LKEIRMETVKLWSLTTIAVCIWQTLCCDPSLASIQTDAVKQDSTNQEAQSSGNEQAEPSVDTPPAIQSGLQESPLLNNPQEEPAEVLPPWMNRPKRSELPELRKATPRDLLMEIDDGELEHLFDYEPIEPEHSTLLEIMYRIQSFSLQNVADFRKQTQDLSIESIVQDPAAQRLKMFQLSGNVQSVDKRVMTEQFAELFPMLDEKGALRNFTHYYQVHAVLDDAQQHRVTICVIDIPAAWKGQQTLNEPIMASGLFLKINSRRQDPVDLLFACKRIEWFPTSESPLVQMSPGRQLLTSHGFELGMLEDARKRNRQPINKVDADCFYRMLGAASTIESSEIPREIAPFDLIGVLNRSSENHGNLFEIDADIRRVTEVKIDHGYYREQFELDHYYQLDGFVDTDVIINDPELQKSGLPSYGKRYPVSICVPRLPAGMRVGSTRKYRISVPVFFFKVWPYQSQLSREKAPQLSHSAPLLIGIQPSLSRFESQSESFSRGLLTLVCIFVFGFIWFGFFRLTRQDRTAARFAVGTKIEPPLYDAGSPHQIRLGQPSVDTEAKPVNVAAPVKIDFPEIRL
jgi:hypothetical protein